jgi:hypothetical protein
MKKKFLIKDVSDRVFVCSHDTDLMVQLLNGSIADRNRARLARQLDNCPQCRDTLLRLSQNIHTADDQKKDNCDLREESIPAAGRSVHSERDISFSGDKPRFLLIYDKKSVLPSEKIITFSEKIFRLPEPHLFSFSEENPHLAFEYFIRECFPDGEAVFDCAFIPELNELSSSFAGYIAEHGGAVMCGLPDNFTPETEKLVLKTVAEDECGHIVFFNKSRLGYHSFVTRELLLEKEIGDILAVRLDKKIKPDESLCSAEGVFSSRNDIFNAFGMIFPSLDLIQWITGTPDKVIAEASVPSGNIHYLSLSVILSYSSGTAVQLNFSPFVSDSSCLTVYGSGGSLELKENSLTMKKKSRFLTSPAGEGICRCFMPEEETDRLELALQNLNDGVTGNSEFFCTSESLLASFALMNGVVESIYNNGAAVML